MELDLLAELGARLAGAKRLLDAARHPQRAQPRLAEAVGHGIAGEGRQLAQRPHAQALQRVHQVDAGPLVAHPLAKNAHLERRQEQRAPRARRRSRRAAAAASEAPPPARTGAWAPRPGARPGPQKRRARSSARSGRPHSARSPSRPKNASPGRRDSTAAPIPSSVASEPSHASSARCGSAGTSASVGQRPSASPSRIPATTPNASAAPDASPITCTPPGSGAIATGRAIISLPPGERSTKLEAGDKGTSDHTNTCSHTCQEPLEPQSSRGA